MTPPPTAFAFARQRIIVADEHSAAVTFIVDTLQRDGHLISRATDAEELRATVRPLLPELRRGSIPGYGLEAWH